ncbi:hypothetical protein CTI12_AA152560 [Artemisia annua]|uniref:Uncharacterized protein n=1 Tax=Artemisia annua TaxID=35608 RepID=A0A2U1PHV4_ARTAN|nr:hypothetical protein CTI12_AA152560 [Artemisia annua]
MKNQTNERCQLKDVSAKRDVVIQNIIREDFVDFIIVSIAHRIPTVMDCDWVIVIDAGRSSRFANGAINKDQQIVYVCFYVNDLFWLWVVRISFLEAYAVASSIREVMVVSGEIYFMPTTELHEGVQITSIPTEVAPLIKENVVTSEQPQQLSTTDMPEFVKFVTH